MLGLLHGIFNDKQSILMAGTIVTYTEMEKYFVNKNTYSIQTHNALSKNVFVVYPRPY